MPNQKPTSRKEWQFKAREKLQGSGIINRLIDHALSEEDLMSASQVNAARVLLNKVLPDLKAVEITGGDKDEPVKAFKIEIVDAKKDTGKQAAS